MTTGARRTIQVGLVALLATCVALLKSLYWPSGSDEMLVATDGAPVQAIVVCSDMGEVLWRVVAPGAGIQVSHVPYGLVPAGWVQEVPTQGPPRDFRKGEHLQVHVLSGQRDMGDGGRATGRREFLTVVNFSAPRQGSVADVQCRPT
jgi:hypothetical protein